MSLARKLKRQAEREAEREARVQYNRNMTRYYALADICTRPYLAAYGDETPGTYLYCSLVDYASGLPDSAGWSRITFTLDGFLDHAEQFGIEFAEFDADLSLLVERKRIAYDPLSRMVTLIVEPEG